MGDLQSDFTDPSAESGSGSARSGQNLQKENESNTALFQFEAKAEELYTTDEEDGSSELLFISGVGIILLGFQAMLSRVAGRGPVRDVKPPQSEVADAP